MKMTNHRSGSYCYSLLFGTLLALILSTSDAFAPSQLRLVQRTKSATNFGRRGGMALFDATTAESSSSAATTDAFDSYQQTDEQRTMVFREKLVGTGDVLEEGKLVNMACVGRLMASGKEFDSSPNGYVFKYGEGKVIPGMEKGMAVSVILVWVQYTADVTVFSSSHSVCALGSSLDIFLLICFARFLVFCAFFDAGHEGGREAYLAHST